MYACAYLCCQCKSRRLELFSRLRSRGACPVPLRSPRVPVPAFREMWPEGGGRVCRQC